MKAAETKIQHSHCAKTHELIVGNWGQTTDNRQSIALLRSAVCCSFGCAAWCPQLSIRFFLSLLGIVIDILRVYHGAFRVLGGVKLLSGKFSTRKYISSGLANHFQASRTSVFKLNSKLKMLLILHLPRYR